MLPLNATHIDGIDERRPMTQVRLSSKYQIVIPADVREQLHLRPGQALEVLLVEGGIRVVPVKSMDELFGSLRGLDTALERDEADRL